MGEHLIDGEFQSDKYPTTPRGKVPLSCKDPLAQDLLWAYAQRRRAVDAEFSADLEEALRLQGYDPATKERGPFVVSDAAVDVFYKAFLTHAAKEDGVPPPDFEQLERDTPGADVQKLRRTFRVALGAVLEGRI